MDAITFTIEKADDKKWVMRFNGEAVGDFIEKQFGRETKFLLNFYDKSFQLSLRGKYYKTFEAIASKAFRFVLARKLFEEERRGTHKDQLGAANINTRR